MSLWSFLKKRNDIPVYTVVRQDPIRKDYTVLIKSTVECIRVLEARMTRDQKDFEEALKRLGTDPELTQACCRYFVVTDNCRDCAELSLILDLSFQKFKFASVRFITKYIL